MPFERYSGKFYRLLHPRPTLVILTSCGGRLDAAPFSWNTPVSEDPPIIAVSMSRSSFTRECLRANPEATLNVIPPEMADVAYRLGAASGRDRDKVGELGLELEPSELIGVPGLAGAAAIYESITEGSVEVGQMDLVLFRALVVRSRAGAAGESGFLLEVTNLALHGAGDEFFRVDPRPLRASPTPT